MKECTILTFWGKRMSTGTAPDESGSARFNTGLHDSSHRNNDKTVKDFIRD